MNQNFSFITILLPGQDKRKSTESEDFFTNQTLFSESGSGLGIKKEKAFSKRTVVYQTAE